MDHARKPQGPTVFYPPTQQVENLAPDEPTLYASQAAHMSSEEKGHVRGQAHKKVVVEGHNARGRSSVARGGVGKQADSPSETSRGVLSSFQTPF